MGQTLWVLPEGTENDDFDHSLILSVDERLDQLAVGLVLAPLTALLDYSVLAEEFGGPVEGNYLEALVASHHLDTLATAIRDGGQTPMSLDFDRHQELLAELEDCIAKCREAQKQGLRVRLAVIP